MGGKSRRKGHDWEREIARRLTHATGVEHQRVLTEPRDGNTLGDVTPKGIDLPYTIQAKCGGRPDIYGAVKEAVAAGPPYHYSIAVIKRTNGKGRPPDELAVMPLEDLEGILSDLLNGGWRR